MIIKSYLDENNVNYSPLLAELTQNNLNTSRINVIDYPDSLLNKLSQLLKKDKSLILYDLLTLENDSAVTKISQEDDFGNAIYSKVPYIFIPSSIRNKIDSLINSVMTEEDRLGFELGSTGTVNILAEAFYQFQMLINKENKDYKQIKSQLRHYYMKENDETGSLIYIKEERY